MAIKSTIFKANLQIADIDHGYYADHALTLARHPSETDERMMVRLAALAIAAHQLNDLCNGDATLTFGAGLSDPDDPDASVTDFTGRKRIWIEVGQPEDKPISKACNKSDHVLVYPFSSAASIRKPRNKPVPVMIRASLITTTATSPLRPPSARRTAKSRERLSTLVYIVNEMMTTPISTAMTVEKPKLPPMPVLAK